MTQTVKLRGLDGSQFVVECNEQEVFRLNGQPCEFLASHSREVYRCGDLVIKISDCEQNLQEYETWKALKPELRKYFAEVVAFQEVYGYAYFYSILIQRFVQGRRTNKRSMVDQARKIGAAVGIGDIEGFANFVVVTPEYGPPFPVIYDLGM